jgi:SAM-dependent methyltransferase
MATQRVTEWLDTPKMDYHERQLNEVYRSTVHFFDWLEKIGYIKPDSRMMILDLACGAGANLAYMAKRYPCCEFIGIDVNPMHVSNTNKMLRQRGVFNAHADEGDWYKLKPQYRNLFDGVVTFQTLGWLPEFTEPVSEICGLKPRWQAHTSLFYEGLVSATTETQTWDEDGNPKRNLFYNVYSIPVVKKFLASKGYGAFDYKPFEIDIDLPNTGEFRSYTEKTWDGRRIQISGPVFMPWYFIAARRTSNGNCG